MKKSIFNIALLSMLFVLGACSTTGSDVHPKWLGNILYSQDINTRYHDFTIPKKRGGDRLLSAPDEDLKKIQKKLAILLQECFTETQELYL